LEIALWVAGRFLFIGNINVMEIKTEYLLPLPLKDIAGLDSQIWLKEDIVFPQGSFNYIHSQSGKGKTSLLSIIYGIREDYEGGVFIDGRNLKEFSYDEIVDLWKNKISMVFQGLNLFDRLTVAENIMLKNKITDFYTEREILEMMKDSGIEDLWNKRMLEISYGQKQRVAVIRALCQPFEIILLDEPFSHLDEKNRNASLDIIGSKVAAAGATVLITGLTENFNTTGSFTHDVVKWKL
jgi:ABC-type lipoprotein export system ATPase subunit